MAGADAVSHFARIAAEQGALQAVFSGWRLRFGRHGVWFALVDRFREVAVEYGVPAVPLGPPPADLARNPVRAPTALACAVGTPRRRKDDAAPPQAVPADPAATLAAVHDLFVLVHDAFKQLVADQSALDEVRATLRLTETGLAELLGVRRQAVSQWRTRGAPRDRAVKLDQYVQLCRLLLQTVKPDRSPAFVRRPVPALHDQTWLDIMRAHGPEAARERLEAVFSYESMG